MPRSDPRIALSGTTRDPFSAFVQGQQIGNRNDLLELANEAQRFELDAAKQDREVSIKQSADRQRAEKFAINRRVAQSFVNTNDIDGLTRHLQSFRQETAENQLPTTHTDQLLDMLQRGDLESVASQIQADNVEGESLGLLPRTQGQGLPAELTTFNAMTQGLSDEDIAKARKIDLGLEPRAATSAQERIATDPTLTGQVASSQGQITGAKTQAEIDVDLSNAEAVGAAEAKKAALLESAVAGEKIKSNRVKTAEEAKVLLPEAEAGANEMVSLLTEIRNHPKLNDVLGFVEGRIDTRIDPEEADLIAKIDQVVGKSFMQAYQSLKGGGPITDLEGRAATDAQSRLKNRNVKLEDYQDAIDDFIAVSDGRIARLRRKAGEGEAQSNQIDPALLEHMTPEERALFQ